MPIQIINQVVDPIPSLLWQIQVWLKCMNQSILLNFDDESLLIAKEMESLFMF